MAINIKATYEEVVVICNENEFTPVEVNEDVHIIKEVVGVALSSSPLAVSCDSEGNVYIS